MPRTGTGPIRHGTMREHNLAVLLSGISAHQPITRAGLASLTGLTKTAVSNLVAVLIEAGLVREGDVLHEGERGRPGVAVTIDETGAAALGLEVNIDYLTACVLDLGRRVRYRHLVEVENRGRSPEEILGALSHLARMAVTSAERQGLNVVGATIALPGILSSSGLFDSPNLDWSGVHVDRAIEGKFPDLRLDVAVDNEANLAALGELWFGVGPKIGDFLHVSGEVGVGAGLIMGRELYRGSRGRAGELGHMRVDPDGPPCACGGRGCLERIVGQEAILRAAGLGHLTVSSGAIPLAPIDTLGAMLKSGDPVALEAVEKAGAVLGHALATATKLFDVDTVVLGGIFSRLGDWMAPAVEKSLQDDALYGVAPSVAVSPLGGDAAVLGAAGLVIERIYADPALLLH